MNKSRLYNYPSVERTKIPHDQIVRDIEKAYELWSSVTPLTFERRYSGDADMRIGFESKDHGDGFPFDDRGGVAGHAFAPASGNPLDGDVHLDDEEIFTEDGKFGN